MTIAAANADADVSVECRAKVGDQIYVSAPLSIHVDRMDALGSIYSWSTTDLGITKVLFSADEADVNYAPATGSGKCVGCHVVTAAPRGGRRDRAARRGGARPEALRPA